MKLLWKIAVPVSCAALICAAAISWHFIKARAAQRKVAEDAKACRALAEQGDANAQAKLGDLYYLGKGAPQDYVQAVEWYRKAADKGNPKGQCGLAYMYQEGKGVPQDRKQATYLYRKAAEQGYAKAEYAMGYSYSEGWEVSQDYGEAVRWYRKAADQGYAKAQSDLGYMYAMGKGVPQNYGEAVSWSRKAADQGYARAESALGYAYSVGAGVPQDYAQSARWYRDAAKHGDDYARRALYAMNPRFTVPDKVLLSITVLGGMLLLINTGESLRSRKQLRVTLAALLLLLSVGLELYGYSHFGILQSLSAVNVFFSCKSFLGGMGVAMLLSFLWPRGGKVTLGICAILFITLNVYATMHYDLRHFAGCPRAFYSLNALLIGTAITLGIFLLTAGDEMKDGQNAVASQPSTT